MSGWVIFLYALELLTFADVAIGLKNARTGERSEVGDGARLVSLIVAAFGFYAIYRVTQDSTASYAVLIGSIYAAINILHFPSFFIRWVRGNDVYTNLRATLVLISSVVCVILLSLLVFAG